MRFWPSFEKLKLLLQLSNESIFRLPSNDLKSVFGSFQDLVPPYHPWSEYNLFHLHRNSPFSVQTHLLLHLLLFILGKTHPAKVTETFPKEMNRKALELSLLTLKNAPRSESASKVFLSVLGSEFTGEQWFYINGLFTNQLVAAMHGNYLASLFGRKIKVIYHPTYGWVMDVLECVRDRIWQTPSKPEAFAYAEVLRQLKSIATKKLVLIAHSQGNLMTAGILKRLALEYPQGLKKMEIYTFANCSNIMQQKVNQGMVTPYLEHFANRNDIVCKVGVLAEQAQRRGEVKLDGPVFIQESWGHLLNTHYLRGIEQKIYRDPQNRNTPRLYQYLFGQSPSDHK